MNNKLINKTSLELIENITLLQNQSTKPSKFADTTRQKNDEEEKIQVQDFIHQKKYVQNEQNNSTVKTYGTEEQLTQLNESKQRINKNDPYEHV